ncbi:MAG: hypothetical protein LBV29_02980 [Azoarcus sp.]|jgi:hypothetical protein|nr:hypothetical protein [Azoarcus sp.]
MQQNKAAANGQVAGEYTQKAAIATKNAAVLTTKVTTSFLGGFWKGLTTKQQQQQQQ